MKDTFSQNIYRPSWIEIDLDAIAHNTKAVKNYLKDKKLLAVVKANAYGHGVYPTASVIYENGADYLGVVMLDEAIECRQSGIEAPILNLGGILPEQAEIVVHYNLQQMVYEFETAKALSEAAGSLQKTVGIHFKVDTGMSRYGVRYDQAVERLVQISSLPNLEIKGIMTHFPMSDALDKSFALLQIDRMNHIKKLLDQKGIKIPLWHACNSGGILDLPAAHYNLVRSGLLLYGYFPSSHVNRPFELKPAMSLKSKIIAVKDIYRGDTVGYGRRFMAEKNERIAVLPIGYADGYSRKLGGIGNVLINGKSLSIVGGLCMDAAFIKITDFPDIKVGDTAILMGKDGEQCISPHDIAEKMGSVSYDVISNFSKRLPLVYLQNNKIIHIQNNLVS